MVADTVRSTAPLHGRPLYPMLVPFPIACFAGTLLTDLVYWRTAEMMWADFSAWLVTAGVILGFIAAIAGLVDFLGSRFTGEEAPTWTRVIGNVLALLLAVLNMVVYTSHRERSGAAPGCLEQAGPSTRCPDLAWPLGSRLACLCCRHRCFHPL